MRRTLILLLVLTASAAVEGRATARCDTVIGNIDGISFGNKEFNEVPSNMMTLRRANQSISVHNGLPVCAGDLISTAKDAQITISMGDHAEEKNEITIYGGSTVELSAPDSLLLKLGRLFAFLRHPFTASTVFGSLGARGTAFELEATADHATLEQLEGSVEFNPLVSGLSLPGWGETRPGLVRVSFPYAGNRLSRPATAHQAGTDPARNIPRLTRLTFGPHQAGSTQQLSVQTCEAWVQRNSEAIVATRPKIPSQPVTTGIENKSALYENARKQAICAESASSLQNLAEVYAAWNQAGDAVHALEKARAEGQLRPTSPIALNNIGNAYRLAGDLKTATRFYEAARQRNPLLALPYNGMGDVSRDQALKIYAQTKGHNIPQVRAYLERAMQYYRRALRGGVWGSVGGTTNRAIALYNAGDVDLLLAIVQPSHADPLLKDAESLFMQAGHPSNFPFADVGLARVQLTRAQLVQPWVVPSGLGVLKTMALTMAEGVRVKLERKPYLNRAEKILKGALQRYPNFSAAAETLGEVIQERGKPRSAAKSYLQAIEMDPHNAVAYLQYSKTVHKKNESRVYAQLSRQIEPSARVAINTGRRQISNPPAPKPRPSRSRLNLSRSELDFTVSSRTRSVTLTNSGPDPLIVGVNLSGEKGSFQIADGCSNRTVEAHGRCSVEVRFIAKSAGQYTAEIVVVNNGRNSPQTVHLSGRIPKTTVVQ